MADLSAIVSEMWLQAQYQERIAEALEGIGFELNELNKNLKKGEPSGED